MSLFDRPLFRPEAVRPKLAGFTVPAASAAGRKALSDWVKLLGSKAIEKKKESELLAEFVRDAFEGVLGYVGPPAVETTVKREQLIAVDGKRADAALGRFGTGGDTIVAVLEGKGPKDPLDRPFAGRTRSAVEQASQYAIQLQIDWYLVTNLRELRLYHKGHDTGHYERFETAKLADDDGEFARFVYLLGAARVLGPAGNHLDDLLKESKQIGRALTNEFYAEYKQLRANTFEALKKHNPGKDPAALLTATQKILDRILFIAFCEDRGLMPAKTIEKAYKSTFTKSQTWQNFLALFRAVDSGDPDAEIEHYNGGLFAKDDFLDSLKLPHESCFAFLQLANWEYGIGAGAKLIDVEILGHIFEQSISDLEEMHKGLATLPPSPLGGEGTGVRGKSSHPPVASSDTGSPNPSPLTPLPQGERGTRTPTKRKKEGAFYTPEFVTRYIVAETLGPVLAERFEAVRAEHHASAKGDAKTALDNPAAFDPAALSAAAKKALVAFWTAWERSLTTFRVIDPACGSGAFLVEAFEYLLREYGKVEGYLTALRGPIIFPVERTLLTENLFGMDLNAEAVEIARLSFWIKTAKKGEVLTSLDANVQQGNSIVAAPDPLTAWTARFPKVFAAGGFDACIGNPPYVRQEWIKADKPFLEQHYKAYDGVADLYVYFYELGLNLLKPGGRLGFIVTNKWMKAGYGEALRKLYGEAAWVESVVDFGHAKQIFPDADVFPSILVARKPTKAKPPAEARVCVIPRETLRIDDLSRQIRSEGVAVPRTRFGAEPWTLEPPGVAKLMEKIKAKGVPLKEYADVVPLYGIKTGFNDAFLLDTPTKQKLVLADPKSESLFRPYLRGQDIDRWQAEWNGLWMLAMKSSGNYQWPWSGKGDKAEAVFRRSYPAIHSHLKGFQEKLVNRQDQGENWWELRACAYWDAFDKPKLMYQDITWFSCMCLDTENTLCNNTVYFLPTDDEWALSTLNSPIAWWYAWRSAQHGKDEALRFFTDYLAAFPIPKSDKKAKSQAAQVVHQLRDISKKRQSGRRAVTDWLRLEFGIEKVRPKYFSGQLLAEADFLDEAQYHAKKNKKPLSVAAVKRLKQEFATSVEPLNALAREADRLERQVSDLVNEAYGLTLDEVKLMWDTAPPRMPVGPPG